MRWTSRTRHRRVAEAGGVGLDAGTEPTITPGPTSAPLDQTGFGPVDVTTLPHLSDVPVGCRVVVLGPTASLRSLSTRLPASWTVEHVDEVGDLTVADLVVIVAPTPGKVAAILARQPEASVVALAHPGAPVDAVVELLQNGATACVRSTEASLVAAHLVACARRYAVGAH